MKKNKQKNVERFKENSSRILNEFVSNTDVDGSYTGINLEDKFAEPIQDVDDL